MKNFLPMMLDLTGKEVVIFGGGKVGERKATFFSGRPVLQLLVGVHPELDQLSEKRNIKLIKVEDLTDNEILRYIKNAFIVIPATSDAILNDNIASVAEGRKACQQG